jgi:hypothetical protein
MPINTDLNVPPYFDDFDENKSFHRILFRPSTAVQARELTQLQSILQNQIERFGDWAFKSGDPVAGCKPSAVPNIPFIRLKDYFYSNVTLTETSNTVDPILLVNTQVVSATSNLRARVILSNLGLSTTYPNTNIVYLDYNNTGTGGETTFGNNEILEFYSLPRADNDSPIYRVRTYANSVSGENTSGNACGISISSGIIYLNGQFLKIQEPLLGLVNAYGTYVANQLVGFLLSEQIITENQDQSLLDNALGYPNENAPGAHRLKLVPSIYSIDPEITDKATVEGFNPIAVYNYGTIVSTAKPTQDLYSIVDDAVSQRIYDQSGNFVVNPFSLDFLTTVQANTTNNSFIVTANQVFGRVNPGVGYAQGHRVSIDKASYSIMRRGIDTANNDDQQITFNYGGYLRVNEYAGSFAFDAGQTLQLYDTVQKAVTTRKFSGLTPAGTNIGTARVRCVTYLSGDLGSNEAEYAIHIFDVKLNSGKSVNDIKSIYYNGSPKGVADVTSQGTVSSGSSRQLFTFGSSGVKTVDTASTYYTYRYKVSSSLGIDGKISITVPGASYGDSGKRLPYGVGILPESDNEDFMVIVTSNSYSANISPGDVSGNASSNVLSGSGTLFLNHFSVGDLIRIDEGDIRRITAFTNAISLKMDAPLSSTKTNVNYQHAWMAGTVLPISFGHVSGSFIDIESNTAFSVYSGRYPSSPATVDVMFDVERKNVNPTLKSIRKNRFVKIDTVSNPAGPWCLGLSDIHKINRVYGSSTGNWSVLNTTGAIQNVDITKNFVFNTGQKDYFYDLGYLYLKPGSTVGYRYLLVQLDYFKADLGRRSFFSVDSYPIDDANTANTTAIQTKDIPLYVSEGGDHISLRDYIDFRIPCANTANDTGAVTMTSCTSVTAAISYATTNPSNTLTLDFTGGSFSPSYGRNFTASLVSYLPRKDLIYITPDNKIKIKEGLSKQEPLAPIWPDSCMPLAVINIPPYPSLSSDQVNDFLDLNQSSINLIRDTRQSITNNLLTNRRYTMKDVGKLDQRITNLEYYAQLSLIEKKAADMTVTDANGLNRFKNGIFVEPFSDFTLADISNPEFSMAIDSTRGIGRPRIVREVVKIDIGNSFSTVNNATTGFRNFYVDATNNVQKTGRVLTLPYTETAFMTQPFATKYRSTARLAYSWHGTLFLFPCYDNHNDTINTGSLNITIDVSKPWQQFAQSPFGQVWGDWKTTTTDAVTTVISGTSTELNLGYLGVFGNQGQAEAAAMAIIHQRYGQNVSIGKLIVSYNSDIRLKHDISLLGMIADGLGLYKYRYLWSDVVYIGVMAQEVIKVIPEAVSVDNDGYLLVDYAKVGIPLYVLGE